MGRRRVRVNYVSMVDTWIFQRYAAMFVTGMLTLIFFKDIETNKYVTAVAICFAALVAGILVRLSIYGSGELRTLIPTLKYLINLVRWRLPSMIYLPPVTSKVMYVGKANRVIKAPKVQNPNDHSQNRTSTHKPRNTLKQVQRCNPSNCELMARKESNKNKDKVN